MRSGYILISDQLFRNTGLSNYTWSSQAGSSVFGNEGLGAMYFTNSATGVNPSNGPTNRHGGLSLRRLFSGGDNRTIDNEVRPVN